MAPTSPPDPITATFGAFDRPRRGDLIDVGLGALRDIDELDRLWHGFALTQRDFEALSSYPGTQGPVSLLELIAELSRRERGHDVAPDRVVLTHGALHGLSVAVSSLPRGAHILFPQPGFGYPFAIAHSGATPVPVSWPLGAPVAELLNRLDEGLARLPAPAGVIACFPSNPGGASPSPAEWAKLQAIIDRHDAVLIADDLYRFTAPGLVPLSGPNVIVIDSLSKRFGAAGLRVGWVHCSGPRFDQLRASAACTSVGVGLPSALLAEHALRRYLADPAIPAGIAAALADRRAAVRAAVPVALRSRLHLNDAGFYGAVELPGVDETSLVAALRGRDLVLTPGAALHAPGTRAATPFVRFCIGADARVGDAMALLADELLGVRWRCAA